MTDLAILGGKPVRKERYMAYPIWGNEEKQALCEVVDKRILSALFGWKKAHEFEERFAEFHGIKYAVAVNSGTAALHCAYSAIDLNAGDEIIIPANAYISAAIAALQLNAVPVFADIDSTTAVLDPSVLRKYITPRTKAVVAVHLYGNLVDMPQLCAVAQKYGLTVIEDGAQAHGATINGRKVGTFGDIAIYSLCCRKHMNAGEGGMIITNRTDWAEAVRRFANRGKGPGWWDYFHIGYSYTMTELQAVFGLSTLKRLPREIEYRRHCAEIYRSKFENTDIEILSEPNDFKYNYFKYPFKLPPRLKEAVAWMDMALAAENVMVERSYPCLYSVPWVRNKEYSAWNLTDNGRNIKYSDGDCPVAEDLCNRLLAASTGPALTDEEICETADAVLKVYEYIDKQWPNLPQVKFSTARGITSTVK